MSKDTSIESNSTKEPYLEGEWSIRPCFLYKEEYKDCTSFKARFHQYFIHGESTDCSQWSQDYDNCIIYEKSKGGNIEAGEKIVESEAQRRNARLKAHYANDTWKKRSSPPGDWAKPLPEWLIKKNENSYLDIKSKEILEGGSSAESPSYCSIM